MTRAWRIPDVICKHCGRRGHDRRGCDAYRLAKAERDAVRSVTDRDLGFAAGVRAAADYVGQFNSTTTHAYRLDDCVLCKFNVSARRRPRHNRRRARLEVQR